MLVSLLSFSFSSSFYNETIQCTKIRNDQSRILEELCSIFEQVLYKAAFVFNNMLNKPKIQEKKCGSQGTHSMQSKVKKKERHEMNEVLKMKRPTTAV